jgi:hypothetical protein
MATDDNELDDGPIATVKRADNAAGQARWVREDQLPG